MKIIKRLITVCLVFIVAPVHAELATNLAIDLRAMSLGNAVTADPPGIMAIHYNPAGLANLKGRRMDLQFLGAEFSMTAEFSAPAGYEVFGFSDDPIVCVTPEKATGRCKDFTTAKSEVLGVGLYIPYVEEFVELPEGPLGGGPLPAFSIQPVGSKFTFANAIYAPMLAGLYRDENDPGRFMGTQLALERFTFFSPSFGYQINDAWSVGLSVGFNYQAMAMNMDFRAPNQLLGFLRTIDESICAPFKGGNANIVSDLFLFGICNPEDALGPFKEMASINLAMDQSLSPSYNLGVLWQPNDKFAWGAVWHGQVPLHLSGAYEIKYAPPVSQTLNSVGATFGGSLALGILGVPANIPDTQTGLVSMDLTFPEHFQMGIKYQIMPRWKVNVDVNWTDYAEWDAFNIIFDSRTAVTSLAKILAPGTTDTSLQMQLGFESNWNWGIGTEFKLTDRLTLRAGYEPRGSAIPENRRSPFVPINKAYLAGIGLGYQWDKDTEVDFTFSTLQSADKIPSNTSCFANCTGIDNFVYNPYAGLDIETKASITIVGIVFRTSW